MINDTPSRFEYAGDGSTRIFPFPAAVISPEYVNVRINRNDGTEEILEYPRDYSVTLVQTETQYLANGEVEILASVTIPKSGETVILYRNTPLRQGFNFSNQGPYFAKTTETALDRAVASMQEHDGRLDATDIDMANLRDEVERTNQISDSALDAANNAVSTANAASSTANTALNKSEAAVNTANAASSVASQAVSTANNAQSQASSAVSTANAANATASTASTTANQAKTTADKAAQDIASEAQARQQADANLQAQINQKVNTTDSRLSDSRTPLAHANTHKTGGSDPLKPGDIGALGPEHLAAADPHPQYVLFGDYGSEQFFTYDEATGLLRLKESAPENAESLYWVLPASGLVTLKGAISGR